ncbi:hypothetical protein C8046_13970 [Serinibacter arcticus]|uniref:Uncharacterized protein n=1 Tax=Serinibacter arcticus TaxID=1655435 RepID=A0A2U1ZX71_9MICO|nr:hypothetical protein [Serinibacter arcticus]PWD51585.1 hypothetical protein C8046_13970 [Serinibacter arcticus]
MSGHHPFGPLQPIQPQPGQPSPGRQSQPGQPGRHPHDSRPTTPLPTPHPHDSRPTTPVGPVRPAAAGGDDPPPRITAGLAWRALGEEARDLVVLTGRLLARYWLVLAGVSALGALAAYWTMRLAVIVSRTGATPGTLVFALVPGITFVAAVAMLTVMGRLSDTGRRSATAALATFGSALLLYLVLYEQNGQLTQDRKDYLYEATMEVIVGNMGTDAAVDVGTRIPQPISFSVISAIAVALLVRSVGARVLERREQRLEAGTITPGRGGDAGTAVLRVLVTYSELVWMVLSVLVAVAIGNILGEWWSSRFAVHAVSQAWASLEWPSIAPSIGAISRIVGTVVGIAVAGILIPTAWLALGAILFGTRRGAPAVLAQRAAEVTATITGRVRAPLETTEGRRGRLGGRVSDLTSRYGDTFTDTARLERSWTSLVRPTSRWGPMGGALGLVLARGWTPVLVFCVIFTVVAQADYAVWWLADLLLPTVAATDWRALYPLVAAVGQIVVQVLTLALVAAGTELTLRRLGLPGVLRLPARGQTSKDQ